MPIGVWDEEGDYLSIQPVYPGILDNFKVLISSLNIYGQEIIDVQDLYTIIKEHIYVRFTLQFNDQSLIIHLKDKCLQNEYVSLLDHPLQVYIDKSTLHQIVNVTLK